MLPKTLQRKKSTLVDVERRDDDVIVLKVSGSNSDASSEAEICRRCKRVLEWKGRCMEQAAVRYRSIPVCS